MRRAVLLSLLALLVVGCRPGEEQVRFPARPKQYRTVASLSPGTTELVASMAFMMQLVGRTAACDYPPQVTTAPIVAQVKPDLEKLKAAQPGLVVYDGDLYSDQDVAQIKTLGIDTFGFKAKTIEEYAKEIQQFGVISASEMEASSYADKILHEREAAMGDPANTYPTVALIMPGSAGQHYIAGTKGFHADVARSAGGKVVGPEADKYVPIDAEALLKLNPDVIVTAGKPDPLVNDPRLQSMPAIKKLRVRGVATELVTRRGFRVEKEINMMHRAILDAAAVK